MATTNSRLVLTLQMRGEPGVFSGLVPDVEVQPQAIQQLRLEEVQYLCKWLILLLKAARCFDLKEVSRERGRSESREIAERKIKLCEGTRNDSIYMAFSGVVGNIAEYSSHVEQTVGRLRVFAYPVRKY